MNRKADVWLDSKHAGYIAETDDGYEFSYSPDFLALPDKQPISLTLPLTAKPYKNTILFPFFDGLIPEGWLLDIAERNWKLRTNDRFGLLLACCRDCIGAVSIISIISDE